MNEDKIEKAPNVPPFVRYVASTIPMVFDNSLSYYEALAALAKSLQDTVGVVNNNATVTEEYIQLTKDMKEYMDHYFDNLDVQEEINNKLDEMVESGEFQTILNSYVEPKLDELEASLTNDINNEAELRASVDEGLQNQINGLASGSPLVASSTSGMRDHSKIYVNTTDGKWYYWSGSAWTAGGTYQSTGIASGSVYYNALTGVAKDETYLTLQATDLPWVDKISYYNGSMTLNNADITTSAVFRVSKGDVIEIADIFRCRITFWDSTKAFVSHTGTFAVHESTTVEQDGWAAISLADNPESGTLIDHDNITNTNIVIKGLKSNRHSYINNCLTFTKPQPTRAVSNLLYVGKGTTVRGYNFNMKNSAGTVQDTMVALYVDCFDKIGGTNIAHTSEFLTHDDYVVSQDCYIRITARLRDNIKIADSNLPSIKNMFDIDYVQPTEQPPFYYGNYPQTYISDNGDIEYVEGGFGVDGHILIRWDNNLDIFRGSATALYDINITAAQSLLSTDSYTYAGKEWLKIGNNRMLYLDLNDNTIKDGNWKTGGIKENVYPLIVNGWQNICGGVLYELYLKKHAPATSIFNSSPYEPLVDWKAKVKSFNALLNTTGTDIETFTFFTDQHLMGVGAVDYATNMQERIGTIQKIYNSTPMNFIVSGGDWLNTGDSADQACFKLGYVDGIMKSMFRKSYMVAGNHDTNYMGNEQISNDTLTNLWYRDTKKAYYSFDGENSKNYVFDSGIDSTAAGMNSYRWEQIDWFAKAIKEDNPTHATVFTHMVWYNTSYQLSALADNFTKVIAAFNAHTTITLNEQTYDFTSNTGHIDYVLCGHLHEDHDATVNGVLCVGTNWFGGTAHAFDLVINDYNANKVKMIRVGEGSNREYNI